jgi:hypothetical protein
MLQDIASTDICSLVAKIQPKAFANPENRRHQISGRLHVYGIEM